MFKLTESNPERPCSDCYITSMEATLKFADGREATTAEHGAWLHHIILLDGDSQSRNAIWAAGNERPTMRLNSDVNKFGIDFPQKDFSIVIDLMSQAPDPFEVKLSITYEYILKSQPEAKMYRASVLIWNDVGYPEARDGVYSFTSNALTAPVSGKLLYAMGVSHFKFTQYHTNMLILPFLNPAIYGGSKKSDRSVAPLKLEINAFLANCTSISSQKPQEPSSSDTSSNPSSKPNTTLLRPKKFSNCPQHMHDGGDKTALYINNQTICTSIMAYNTRPGYGEPTITGNTSTTASPSHSHSGTKELHISDPGVCFDFGSIKEGDRVHITAFYDTNKYPVQRHHDVKEKLMGIMRVFVGPDEKKG